MEPPSRQLIDLLTRFELAKPRDLRRCRPIVRRLARDLPTFDSVWIDALTQNRVLTPFQARLLESETPEQLGVGPCVLVDHWEHDGHWTLYLARHRVTRRKCLLTYVHVADEALPRAREGVRDLVSALRGLSHPSIILPQGCDELSGRLIVVSPFTNGPTLQQLLIRRGRFPIPVVVEIERQLVDALSALESRGVVHGDLRLSSIRLTRRGQAILLNPGVLPAVGRRTSFHDAHSPDAYDGIAPELISTGLTASFRSDLYALGCLLWHLLAGRPPFPTGDALTKLAAHQSRPIDDVRRWRPDAPPELAALIGRLTQKDPQLRPAGPREVRDSARFGQRPGRRQLARFHASFGAVAPRRGDSHRNAARFPWPVAAVLLFVLSGLSLGLFDAGARNELLRLASRMTSADPPAGPPSTIRVESTTGNGLLPFPDHPVDGVIELNSPGPYRSGSISTDRPLTIRAASGIIPTVVIGDEPLRITAQSLQLQGIHFVAASGSPAEANHSPLLLLAVQSQQVAIESCTFERTIAPELGAAIAWRIRDEADPAGGRFVARHSRFSGSLRALDLHAMPRVIGFDNCLKRGPGPLMQLSSGNRSTPLRVHLRQTTLRDSGGIVQWMPAAAKTSIQPLLLVLEDSVFALGNDGSGLLEFAAQAPLGWDRLLQVTGEGSLVRPGTPLAIAQYEPLDDSRLRVEGLLIDEFDFAAEDDAPDASLVVAMQAPRSTPTPPGIDPTRFASDTTIVRRASHEYNDHKR